MTQIFSEGQLTTLETKSRVLKYKKRKEINFAIFCILYTMSNIAIFLMEDLPLKLIAILSYWALCLCLGEITREFIDRNYSEEYNPFVFYKLIYSNGKKCLLKKKGPN